MWNFCDKDVCNQIEWWNVRVPLFTVIVGFHSRSFRSAVERFAFPYNKLMCENFTIIKARWLLLIAAVSYIRFNFDQQANTQLELSSATIKTALPTTTTTITAKQKQIETNERGTERIYFKYTKTINAHFICMRCVCPRMNLKQKQTNELFDAHFFRLLCVRTVCGTVASNRKELFFFPFYFSRFDILIVGVFARTTLCTQFRGHNCFATWFAFCKHCPDSN